MELQGTPQAGRMLSWALPVLLHRLANQTQWITGLRSVLGLGGGDEWLRSKGSDLAHAGQNMQDIGWLLAVFGSAQGNNLLLTRREPRGLELMIELVAEGIAKETGCKPPLPGEIPYLTPNALDGWQLPFAIGSLLWHAYAIERATDGFQLYPEGETRWVLDLPWKGTEQGLWGGLEECLPGAQNLAPVGGRLRLALPGEWLADRGA